MVLPAGVNKATGLKAALADIRISPHNVVAVGDAENDHALLRMCGCSAAVANALPAVKEEADVKLAGDHGKGVMELIEMITRDDARIVNPARQGILLGRDRRGNNVYLAPDQSVLIAGGPCTGKSRFATLFTERMVEKSLDFCVIDAEPDYKGLLNAVCVEGGARRPMLDEALALLQETPVNIVINTLSLRLSERQNLFANLIEPLARLRTATGRPHWLLIDEAHQVLPAAGNPFLKDLPVDLPATVLITVNPASLSLSALRLVESVVAFGRGAQEVLETFAGAMNILAPPASPPLDSDEVVFWCPRRQEVRLVRLDSPRQVHRRHKGKYALGDVGEWRSFYFRGPNGAINLRAQNLLQFLRIGGDVDDAVWMHHLRNKDYSAWFKYIINDEDLARETAEIERDLTLSPSESRKRIGKAILSRYAAPTTGLAL